MEKHTQTNNKMVIIENIYRLAKERDIKIGSLEEKAGVSKGYLSRFNKPDGSQPSLETISIMADELGVSIDYLLHYDAEELSLNEDFLLKFIEGISKATNKNKLEWCLDTNSSLIRNSNNIFDSGHPLVEVEPYYSEDFDCNYYSSYYESMFSTENVVLLERSYHVEIDNATIYLMSVRYNTEDKIGEEELELYLYQGRIMPLCSTGQSKDVISDAVRRLYGSLTHTENNVGLEREAKKIMETILVTVNKL